MKKIKVTKKQALGIALTAASFIPAVRAARIGLKVGKMALKTNAGKAVTQKVKGNIIKGMSDRKVRIQDEAIMKEWAKRKRK